jgi:hypothetical protein
MNPKETFDILFKAADVELAKTQQAGTTYIASGDTVHIHEVADRIERIQSLLQVLHQLQDQWQQLFPELSPSEPLLPFDPPLQRTPPGIKTPQEQYRLPILQALVEMGGKARTRHVLDRVGELMAEILNDFDRDRLPQGRDIRWRNTAMWERLDMVKEGLLSDHSPNGTWEITEAGIIKLKESHP